MNRQLSQLLKSISFTNQLLRFIFFGILFILQSKASAQNDFFRWLKGNPDSIYYEEFSKMLTLKVHSSLKYANFNINDERHQVSLHFKSNPIRVLGIGANYQWFGFNIGYGFSSGYPGKETYGKTKHLDLQAHIRLRKFAVNFFSNTYTGHYLDNSWNLLNNWEEGTYLTRGDIKNSTYGLNINYFLNFNKYSNRATLLQTDWQKKTSGSFIVGGTVFYNAVIGDSAIIPSNLIDSDFFRGVNYSRSGYFAVGANAGYAFTLVVRQNWFVNLSLTGGLAYGHTSLDETGHHELSSYKMNLNLIPGFGAGYNSKYFSTVFSYTGFQAASPSPIEGTSIGFDTGRFRLSVAYRLKVKKEATISELLFKKKQNKT